jgi:ATP-binding cassette subfamily B protein
VNDNPTPGPTPGKPPGSGELTDEQKSRQQKVAAEARSALTGAAGRATGAGMPAEKPRDMKGSAARLLSLMGSERRIALVVVVLAVVSVGLTVVGPRVLGKATDTIVDGISSPAGIDFTKLHQTLLLALGLYLSGAVLSYLQNYLLAGLVQRTMYRLREMVEVKIHRLPLSYVDRRPRGDLLSRVTNDIDNVAQSLQQTLGQLLNSSLTIIGVVVMMVLISPLLSLVALATIPLALFGMRAIASRSKPRFMAQWAHTGALNAHVEESFTGHNLVKVFGNSAASEAHFDEVNEELYRASFSAQFISGIIQPMMMFIGNLNFVAIAVIGGIRVSSGSMTIGEVQAFIQYSRQFTQPLTQVASMVNVLQSGIASAERVFVLLDVDEESPEPDDSQSGTGLGRVEFRNVDFSYDPERPLIHNLNLVAEPGETIAIVGPTGAGKTTMVNLIERFYELDSGSITIDGVEISTMSRQDLRSQIAMVLQDTWLFGGTIRENIAYGNLMASEEQIRAAAKATFVDRFVHSLPEGYDTVIDDEGGNVSTGEKQLITIARAFLADPSILILDEATSSVDTRTEVLIQDAMSALRSNRTSFVIAHRLSTIRDADTILVMEDGHIVEQGDHETLLEANGAYAHLYNAQFIGAAADID